MSIAYIGLGSNMGDREAHIHRAIAQLGHLPDVEVVAVSSLYESPAWGKTDQEPFLNAVAQVQTIMPAESLLVNMLQLEHDAGRDRFERWGPRTLDLDLLSYDDKQVQLPNLILPHPHWAERLFVLVPWMEIAPHWVPAGQQDTVTTHARKQMQLQPADQWPVMLAYHIA